MTEFLLTREAEDLAAELVKVRGERDARQLLLGEVVSGLGLHVLAIADIPGHVAALRSERDQLTGKMIDLAAEVGELRRQLKIWTDVDEPRGVPW